jgi:putative aminopeptidase FrvX
MPLDDTLRSLLVAQGPSGYETAPSAAWRAAAERFASDVSIDAMGNLTARVPSAQADSPTLALVGHIDEIGLIVTHIDDKGRLFFIGIGGWDPQVLVSQRVDVTTRDGVVPGVVGRKAIHLLEEDERKKAVELKDLCIDIGARDGDEAKALVRVGDVAVIAGEPVELPNERVVARAMDNRPGAYIALEAARLVAEGDGAAWDVVAAVAVQEEVGLNGARALAHGLRPDVAIVHAQRADASGDAQIWGLLGCQKEVAFAADRVIVVCEEMVEESVIRADPNRTVIPGVVVDAVVEEPFACHPSFTQGYYDRDNAFYLAWDAIAREAASLEAWLDEWVYGLANHAEYVEKMGARLWDSLRPEPAMSGEVDYGRYA